MAKMRTEDIWPRIATLWEDDASAFEVLRPGPEPRHEKILLLLIHPGDAVEAEGSENVIGYSNACQDGMSEEILALVEDGADTAVLHRLSSHYSIGGTMECTEGYRDAIDAIHASGAVLYGDDLDEAASWVERNLMASRRPAVVMSGAWAHPEWGCITHIAQRLEALGARVSLSPHASICPGGPEPC